MIAYAGTGPADFDILAVTSAGGPATVLLAVAGNDLDPVWSPDGRRLAVATRAATPAARNIAVLDTATGTVTAIHPDGTDPHPLTSDHITGEASWFPDAEHVVFAHDRAPVSAGADLYIAELDTAGRLTDIRRLTALPGHADYRTSPRPAARSSSN